MAEASSSRNCMFCEKKAMNDNELHKHLNEAHNISLTVNLNRDSQFVKQYFAEFHGARSEGSFKDAELNEKVTVLKSILEYNFYAYLIQLKLWIRSHITSEEFYQNVRPFFSDETISVHNDFIIFFLKRIRVMAGQQQAQAAESEASKAQQCDMEPSIQIHDAVTEEQSAPTLTPTVMDGPNAVMVKNFIARMCLEKLSDKLAESTGAPITHTNEENEPELPDTITLQDLLAVLQAHPEAFPIKSVYTEAMKYLIERFAALETTKRVEPFGNTPPEKPNP